MWQPEFLTKPGGLNGQKKLLRSTVNAMDLRLIILQMFGLSDC